MRIFLRPFRLVSVAAIVILFLLSMSFVWLFVRDRWKVVRIGNLVLRFFSRRTLEALNIKARILGLENLPSGSALLVGNHLSYTDVLVISSQVPTCFVTSTEVKNSPGLGQICQMAGCLFVERRNKANLRNEVAEISEGLKRGLKVAIFPEATSTNGEALLRFRKPLYLAAIDAKVPVVPFCLNYRTVGGQPINPVSRDNIFWYGDMDFLPHLWRLSGAGGVEVELNLMPALEVGSDSDASIIAEASQRVVEKVFLPVK